MIWSKVTANGAFEKVLLSPSDEDNNGNQLPLQERHQLKKEKRKFLHVYV